MERADDASVLTRFDELEDRLPLIVMHQTIVTWASDAQLAPEPAMPRGLRGRAADNWRVLLSIADAYGKGWGERAREAAMIMARGYRDEDITVTLLRHIRDIFTAHSVDRIASAALVAALCDLEDAPWAEWRGAKDDQPPRKLTQATLASLLKAFHDLSPDHLAGGAHRRQQKPQGVLQGRLQSRLGLILPGRRHTGTAESFQALGRRLSRHRAGTRPHISIPL